MTPGRFPRFRKRRVLRIRTELGLWLAQHVGGGKDYSKSRIDQGREALGFESVDDALVAYLLFGPDLVPDFLALNDIAELQDEIESSIESIVDDAGLAVLGDSAI